MKTKFRKAVLFALAICMVASLSALSFGALGEEKHEWISNKDVSVTLNSNGTYEVGSTETFHCSVENCSEHGSATEPNVNLTQKFNDAVNGAKDYIGQTLLYNEKGTTYVAMNNAYNNLVALTSGGHSSEEIRTKITTLENAVEAFNADSGRYIEYKVEFISDGKTIQSDKLHYGDEIKAPKNPEKASDVSSDSEDKIGYRYVFECWLDKTGKEAKIPERVTESSTYTAKFHQLWHRYTKKPTCIQGGTAEFFCIEDGCDYPRQKNVYVEALGHNWDDGKVVKKTLCTDESYIERTCLRCGEKDKAVFEKAEKHELIDVAKVNATCTTNGATAGKKCKKCPYTEGMTVINATGHTPVVDKAVAATCTEKGLTEGSHCSVCNEVIKKQEETKALGHEYKKEERKPTCTEKGGIYYTCKREGCGHSYIENEKAALGHTWDDGKVTEPTCTEAGFTTYTCKVCGQDKKDKPTKALGHDETVLVIKPTCLTGGYTLYTCKRCANERKTDETEALSHDYEMTAVQPTCTEKGYDHYVCKNCGDEFKLNEKDPLGHTYNEDYKRFLEPTCTQAGYDARICVVCGFEDRREVVALGHDYGDWSTVTEATCTTDGLKESICRTCGDTQQEVIKAIGHDWGEWEEAEQSTCGKKGKQIRICNNCGEQDVDELPFSGDHKWKEITEKATMEEDGRVYTVCSVCDKVGDNNKIYKIASVKLGFTSVTYNGDTRKPKVTVKDSKGVALINGTDYTVKYESGRKNPGMYTVKVTFKGDYSGSKTLSFKIRPEDIESVKSSVSMSAVKLKWSKIYGATGYRVFRYDYSSKSYKKIADVTGTTYTDKELKSGTKYTYRVQAFTKDGGSVCWSAERSPSVVVMTKPSAPKVTLKAGTDKATISYNKVRGAYGYQIYMATSKGGEYERIKTTDLLKYTKTKLTTGKTYYFKVRAYTKVGDVKTYSSFSTTAKVKVK